MGWSVKIARVAGTDVNHITFLLFLLWMTRCNGWDRRDRDWHEAVNRVKLTDVADSDVDPVKHAPVPEYGCDGVDVTLIRWMLSLTPAGRLQFLQERIEDVQAIRQLNAGR